MYCKSVLLHNCLRYVLSQVPYVKVALAGLDVSCAEYFLVKI